LRSAPTREKDDDLLPRGNTLSQGEAVTGDDAALHCCANAASVSPSGLGSIAVASLPASLPQVRRTTAQLSGAGPEATYGAEVANAVR
jgi:hypothetical protein